MEGSPLTRPPTDQPEREHDPTRATVLGPANDSITGATSGIGLATARLAAQRGARLVLATRNGEALSALASEIEPQGGEAVPAVADVGHENDVGAVAHAPPANDSAASTRG